MGNKNSGLTGPALYYLGLCLRDVSEVVYCADADTDCGSEIAVLLRTLTRARKLLTVTRPALALDGPASSWSPSLGRFVADGRGTRYQRRQYGLMALVVPQPSAFAQAPYLASHSRKAGRSLQYSLQLPLPRRHPSLSLKHSSTSIV